MTGRIWWFFGFISYPLYLIHENLGVALLIKLQKLNPLTYSELYLPLVILLVTALAWLMARYAEVPLRRALQKLLSRQ
jgi:peptidoglycan/LPS O-acetylase OafA/YrhL